jgi:hypothetical protein
MTTKLQGPLKRELVIGGEPYTLTVDPKGLKLVPKAKRRGYELDWEAFLSGDAALATALNASLAKAPQPGASSRGKPRPHKRKRRGA